MAVNEDYTSLVKGLNNLDFSGEPTPCKLLLTGDIAFPVLVSPAKDVLIAASKYGKGRIVAMAHESYLNQPPFMAFLKNAIQWLKPSSKAKVGVDPNLGNLIKDLGASGYTVEATSVLKEDLGVLCVNGYDESKDMEMITYLRKGGGLLIGAQAVKWSQSHKEENVLFQFPANKITCVAGVYFTDKHGEKGVFPISKQMPYPSIYYDVDFSMDIKLLLENVPNLDIKGNLSPSRLLLHGPLTFPLGVTDKKQCFFGAGYYGRGRVVVGSHDGFLNLSKLSTFMLNAFSWLRAGKKGKVGIQKHFNELYSLLEKEGIPCALGDFSQDLSVYCCNAYGANKAEEIQQFVAEGGGLLIAGRAWGWTPNNTSKFPGNEILTKTGISILEDNFQAKDYAPLENKSAADTYHILKAANQFVNEFQQGKELGKPLNQWLWEFGQDILHLFNFPDTPVLSSLKHELATIAQNCDIPNISKEHPAERNSKEVLISCLLHVACCFVKELDANKAKSQGESPVTVQIDATKGFNQWISTGLYVPSKKRVILEFPPSSVMEGLQVQIGCQSDRLEKFDKFNRALLVTHNKEIRSQSLEVFCVFGGLLYFIVKENIQVGEIKVKVYGAEEAPTFTKGKTSLPSWVKNIRHLPAPWAELITKNIILTVPSDSIRSLEDPEALLSLWDKIMDTIVDLGRRKFLFPERFVADVQIAYGIMHAGYPIMCKDAPGLVNVQTLKNGNWAIIHELGHNQQQPFWNFSDHTLEATCNLWSVYVFETLLGISRDKAHNSLKPSTRKERIETYLKNGAKLSDWRDWVALESYLQLQEGFGWDPYKRVFEAYNNLSWSEVGSDDAKRMNFWVEIFSKDVKKNLAPFYQAWGWPVEEALAKKLSEFPAWDKDPMKAFSTKPKTGGS